MWIICAGSKRSGSTLQYNIVSRIVELKGLGKRLPHSNPEEFSKVLKEQGDYTKIKVYKSHTLTNEMELLISESNAKVVYCYRDLRDVVVSLIKKEWLERDLKSISNFTTNYIADYDKWYKYSNQAYTSKYENFYNDIKTEIGNIAEYLNIDLLANEIDQITIELSYKNLQNKVDENYVKKGRHIFNNSTLLHENHIQGRVHGQYKELLSQHEILAIETIAYKWLSNLGYELDWSLFNNFISLSQHADDYITWQLLGKKNEGLVVEVGAFDGIHLSNSYSLSQKGWDSICIEPNPVIFNYLKKNRPFSKNFNSAVVGDEEISDIDFFAEEIGVLSGCNYDADDVKRRYQNRGIKYSEPNKLKVPATTLSSLFAKLNIKDIDALSIDVEGFELEVLKGLNFEYFNIKLFIIEANDEEYKTQILKLFKNNTDYVYIGNNYQNLFFIKKKFIFKRNIRSLDFENYIKAKQYHPKGIDYVIESVPPKFIESEEGLKFKKYLGIF